MATTTRVYANAMAINSGKRLDGERFRRIIEAKDVAEAMKMLGDYGYAYAEGDTTIDGFVVAETDRLIDFICENCSSDKLKDALLARFWYNNVKLAYKSRFTSVPADGFYRLEKDARKIADGIYEDADGSMLEALEALDAAGESRPQEIDLALTRAMYKSVLACGIPLVKKYFRTEIDMKNIITAARMRKLGLSGDGFIKGGRVPMEKLRSAAAGEESFAELFDGGAYAELAARIDEAPEAMWKAENDLDDRLFFLTDRQVDDFTSFAPFINYYTGTLIELKTVKMALVCIKTDARDVFYARIPAVYR